MGDKVRGGGEREDVDVLEGEDIWVAVLGWG